MEDIIIKKLQSAFEIACYKIVNNVNKLSYFNPTNYQKNISSLKKIIISDEKAFSTNQIALYDSFSNSIIVDFFELTSTITVEQLALLILHELVHMMSTNRELNKIGYSDDSLPLTYNEACTQWITLKLFYDNNNFKQGLTSNFIYPESVKELDRAINNELNEEILFSGFFEADIHLSIALMNSEQKSKWLELITKMVTSSEEEISLHSMKNLQQKITDVKK